MDTLTVDPIQYGWRLTVDNVTLDALTPYFDRGVIRSTLIVKNCEAIYFKDTVNLTSDRARQRILRRLEDKGVTVVQDAHLIALEEACRRKPAPPDDADNKITRGGSDFSGKATQLLDVQRRITSWLLLRDPDFLPVTLGAIHAHRLGGAPVWLLLVAPPSGTKTELILACNQVPGTYYLSELTARTFASGLDVKGEDPSLLARLSQEILLLKDFTTVLQMHREERQAILAQLREIYDGRYDKTWGTGKELHWQGRLGFVAGVTPIIDKHHGVLSVLGERFLMMRVEQADRREVASKALQHADREDQMRQELADVVGGFLLSLPLRAPTVPETICAQLAQLCDFVTRCRSGVVRDGYKAELEYAPEPEMPARLAKQLFSLLRGVAGVCGHETVTQEDYDRVARVALDCIPAVRRLILRELAKTVTVDAPYTTTQVAAGVQYSTQTVRRALEDLQALGILTVEKQGQGVPDKWRPLAEWQSALATLTEVERLLESRRKATFPEKSEGGCTTIYFRRPPLTSGSGTVASDVPRLS